MTGRRGGGGGNRRRVDPNVGPHSRDPALKAEMELNLLRLTRAHVEAVCRELGPDHAWVRLGISRSTLYKWRRDWRRADEEAEAAAAAEGSGQGGK